MEHARPAGRAVCVSLNCVVQAGPGLGGCGAHECESELRARPPAAAGPRHCGRALCGTVTGPERAAAAVRAGISGGGGVL